MYLRNGNLCHGFAIRGAFFYVLFGWVFGGKVMKKYRVVFLGLILGLSALAQDLQQVTVTGDRVSLRAAPEINAVLLDRAALNDQLVLSDNSNPEWVGVRPPQNIDFWVNAEYICDDVVLPARLNVRSGPSLSHGVVGIVARDKTLTVRGTLDGWVRIAPPEETVVWISRKYTDTPPRKSVSVEPVKSTDADEPILITGTEAPVACEESNIIITVVPNEPAWAEVVETETTKEDAEQVVKTVLQPVINDVMIAAVGVSKLPETLTPDPEKEQGAEEQFSGILQPANAILYKLVDPTLERDVICYVRGNTKQMETYAGRSLTLSGRVYWTAGLEQPFLVPEKIKVLPNKM